MRYFSGAKPGRTIVMQLEQGDDVLLEIKNVIKKENIRNGYIASGIGTLDMSHLHMVTTTSYPPKEVFPKNINKALEVSNISGFIADAEPHLHITISDDTSAVAGHLEEECRILYLGEIVIQEIIGIQLERRENERKIMHLYEKQK